MRNPRKKKRKKAESRKSPITSLKKVGIKKAEKKMNVKEKEKLKKWHDEIMKKEKYLQEITRGVQFANSCKIKIRICIRKCPYFYSDIECSDGCNCRHTVPHCETVENDIRDSWKRYHEYEKELKKAEENRLKWNRI